jgi:Tfp pilus assembly protein PilN
MAFQIIRKAQLESQWAAMEPRVAALESLQQQLRTYRPWFDNTVPSLDILRKITGCFPEEGSVWAKHISIKDNRQITCSGMARSNQALMETLDRLRQEDTVADVQVKQVRGEDPIQFTFSFVWNHAVQD